MKPVLSPGRFSRLGVASSVLFHAAVVALLLNSPALPKTGPDGETALVVAITIPPPPEPEPEPEPEPQPKPEEKPAPKVEPVQKPIPAPTPKPEAPKKPVPTAKPKPAAEPSPASLATEPPAPADPAPVEATSAPSAAPPAAPATSPSAPAGDDRLQRYAQLLWTQIMEHKPKGIRMRGTVGLTFKIGSDGRVLSATVSRSSGRDSLDQVALDALTAAQPFPPPPETAGSFTLSFEFR